MKENIEEDIKILERLITTKFNNDYSIDNKDKEAIKHILSDYKRVLKENEEMKEIASKLTHRSLCQFSIGEFKYLANNFIPVQKVKDKLENVNSITLIKLTKEVDEGHHSLEYMSGYRTGKEKALQSLLEEKGE